MINFYVHRAPRALAGVTMHDALVRWPHPQTWVTEDRKDVSAVANCNLV